MIYMDCAATTKPTKEVIADIAWCLENMWGNPSSTHTPGIEAKRLLEQSREKVARFIGAEPEEIIFTSSGSESNNLAIKVFLDANDKFDCIISTKVEHPSVYNTCQWLGKGKYRLEYTPVDEYGKVDVNKFRIVTSILSETYFCFASIMFANNEVGTINDIKEIAKIVRRYKGVLHVDATQAIAQIPVDVKELDCDLLTFSGHKFNLPKGIGVLYKRKGVNLSPIIHGGHQENGYVAGTENLPYIYALGNQVERMKQTKSAMVIREHLRTTIFRELKDYKIYTNGSPSLTDSLPNILSLTFDGVSAEALITLLDMQSIYVSAGSACSSGTKEPSRVLKAIGLTDEEAFSTVRISVGEDATIEECDEFVRILGECLQSLKMVE